MAINLNNIAQTLKNVGTVFGAVSAVVLGVATIFGTIWAHFAKDDVQDYIRYQILLALSGYDEEYIQKKNDEDKHFLTTTNLLEDIEMPDAAEDLRRKIDAIHLLEFSRSYDFQLDDDGSFKKDENDELLKTENDKSTRWFHATKDQHVCLAFRVERLSAQLEKAMARYNVDIFASIGSGEHEKKIQIDKHGVNPTPVTSATSDIAQKSPHGLVTVIISIEPRTESVELPADTSYSMTGIVTAYKGRSDGECI